MSDDNEFSIKKAYRLMCESETYTEEVKSEVVEESEVAEESAAAIDNSGLINDLLKKAIVSSLPRLRSDIEGLYQSVGKLFNIKSDNELQSVVSSNPAAKDTLSKLEGMALAIEELSDSVNNLK